MFIASVTTNAESRVVGLQFLVGSNFAITELTQRGADDPENQNRGHAPKAIYNEVLTRSRADGLAQQSS